MKEYLNIPYADPRHGKCKEFDLYVPDDASSPAPLLCFVHGGAWRSEDKSKHAQLARRLAQLTSFPVAIPNYRLTKPDTFLKHPAHAEDLLQFLHFILEWQGPKGTGQLFDPSRLYAFGHSCSAHMLTSILLSPPSKIALTRERALTPLPCLLKALKGIVLSEGIYDIDMLLHSFPVYREWFITNTFGDRPSYQEFNTASYGLRDNSENIRWLVIHSKGDTLVDEIQSQIMLARLQEQLDVTSGHGSVEANWELTSDHNDILKEEDYPKIVAEFVLRLEDTRCT